MPYINEFQMELATVIVIGILLVLTFCWPYILDQNRKINRKDDDRD